MRFIITMLAASALYWFLRQYITTWSYVSMVVVLFAVYYCGQCDMLEKVGRILPEVLKEYTWTKRS